jgi:anti-sigma28 factor (negative regulator of flagellin synthesis)
MSGINGVGNNQPVHKVVNQPIQRSTSAEPSGRTSNTDRLELSGMSHLLKTLKNDGVRTDKVASIKAQIEAGTYENDQKMDAAIHRLIDDLDL